MIIVLKPGISEEGRSAVLKEIRKLGYKPHVMRGVARTVIGAIGDERTHQTLETLDHAWPQVESVMPVQKRYKLVSREAHPAEFHRSRVRGHGHRRQEVPGHGRAVLGGEREAAADHRRGGGKAAGATILRGGAFKPRTSPYEFQGLGEKGLKLLAKARKETGLAVITELLSEHHAELVAEYADIIQIGARNAQNFQLLIAAAKTGKPVLLKRGLSMKIEEWLLAGEYVLANENPNLMFCERGIRTFETYTRNTLDLSTIPIIKKESHCPIVIDPSQGAGRADLVTAHVQGRGGHGRRRAAHRGASQSRRGLERWRAAGDAGRVRATDGGAETLHRGGGTGIRRGRKHRMPWCVSSGDCAGARTEGVTLALAFGLATSGSTTARSRPRRPPSIREPSTTSS